MKKKVFFKKILAINVCVLLLSIIFVKLALATEINVVTDADEMEKLLGANTENARESGVLGIANLFSIFAKESVTTYGSDIEGRIAVGQKADFGNSSWKYQVGCGYNGYEANSDGTAEVIVGEGPVINLNVDVGATTSGTIYNAPKTVVVQNIDEEHASSIIESWGYTEGEVSKFTKAELVNFDDEFNWLENQSQKLANLGHGGTVSLKTISYFAPAVYNKNKNIYELADSDTYYYTDGGTAIDYERTTEQVVVFTGTNKDYNVFNIDVNTFNSDFGGQNIGEDSSMYKNTHDMIFNVPDGSYVIINVKGTGTVNFIGSFAMDPAYIYTTSNPYETVPTYSTKPEKSIYRRTFVPYSETDIANDTDLSKKMGIYLLDESTNDFVRDSEGNYLLFVDIANDTQNKKNQDILYNVPDATSFTLTNNFSGSILAPKADGRNTNTNRTDCVGHLAGNLVCKSYNGTMQFGYMPSNITLNSIKYDVNIAKIDADTSDKLSGAVLQLYSLNVNDIEKISDTTKETLVKEWTSTTGDETFTLDPGAYYIIEKQAPENYEKETEKTYFTVDEYGNIVKNVDIEKDVLNEEHITLDEFPYEYEPTVLAKLKGTVNEYRATSITFKLNAVNDELKGKNFGVHIGTNYNYFRSSNNIYTSYESYVQVEDLGNGTFRFPVYGWGNSLNVQILDEDGNILFDKRQRVGLDDFSFSDITVNIPTNVTKNIQASANNSSLFEGNTISISNKKIIVEEELEEEKIEEEPKQEDNVEETKEEQEDKKEDPVLKGNAKTGDSILTYATIFIFSFVIVVAITRKRNKK